jgi:cyclophilin family peptidyl-prolyl cis-trans isomerase
MKQIILITLVIMLAACKTQQKTTTSTEPLASDYVKDIEMVTNKGTIIIRLYEQTPQHRNNFIKLVKQKFYDSLLFHRVIQKFMIQGGDPNSKRVAAGQPLGEGGLGYTVPAEFSPLLFHKKGAIAAARDNNPAKASSSTQFYIVQGLPFTDESIATAKARNRWPATITPEQTEVYKTLGGTPHLDQNYTVFGEVVQGLPIVDSIAAVPKGSYDRPIEDVRIIKMRLINRIKN